jgi:hypothetical protein
MHYVPTASDLQPLGQDLEVGACNRCVADIRSGNPNACNGVASRCTPPRPGRQRSVWSRPRPEPDRRRGHGDSFRRRSLPLSPIRPRFLTVLSVPSRRLRRSEWRADALGAGPAPSRPDASHHFQARRSPTFRPPGCCVNTAISLNTSTPRMPPLGPEQEPTLEPDWNNCLTSTDLSFVLLF